MLERIVLQEYVATTNHYQLNEDITTRIATTAIMVCICYKY